MNKISLIILFTFSINQVFAFSVSRTDHQVDIALENLSNEVLTAHEVSDKSNKSQKKFIRYLEKEIKKVEDMTGEQEVSYLNKRLLKLSKRSKRLFRQLQRAAKNRKYTLKVAQRSNLDQQSIKSLLVSSSEYYRQDVVVKNMKEDIESAGGYKAYLEQKIQEIKNISVRSTSLFSKKSGRSIADSSIGLFGALVILYMMISPSIAVLGLIVAAIGGIVMLATGGLGSAALFVGLGLVGSTIPAGILFITL
ncbi:MAG: hypothetical protein N4A33_06540 [Bacteriovoracaceae bacterium]|jgi:hypothetical protein|nr:hypothetical protein [Bacteriovoracaceae bacterium]